MQDSLVYPLQAGFCRARNMACFIIFVPYLPSVNKGALPIPEIFLSASKERPGMFQEEQVMEEDWMTVLLSYAESVQVAEGGREKVLCRLTKFLSEAPVFMSKAYKSSFQSTAIAFCPLSSLSSGGVKKRCISTPRRCPLSAWRRIGLVYFTLRVKLFIIVFFFF